MNKVYYNQADSRWANHPYTSANHPNATCKTSGCGATCAAMVVSSCREPITPNVMCDISKENGYRALEGTSDELFNYIAQRWNIETKRLHSSYEAHEACKNGYFVIITCRPGLWTTGGHYILAVGANANEIEIYDPYLYNGKFNRTGRKGKVRLDGVSAWVEINTFKANSNAQRFIAFKINEDILVEEPIQTNKPAWVNTKSSPLNVRDNPNGNIIGKLEKGTKVIVYETIDNWSRVDQGWVSNSYLTYTEPTSNTVTKTRYVLGRYRVIASALNVRTGAGTNFKVKKAYKHGTVFDTYEMKSNWARTPSGWVCLDYCNLIRKY